MIRIKSMVKKAIFNDPFQLIYSGVAKTQDYSLAIHTFQTLDHSSKDQIAAKVAKKLQKTHPQNKKIVSLLILCDFLSSVSPEIFKQYPHELHNIYKQKIKGNLKQDKRITAQNTLILFYLQFLKNKVWGIKYSEQKLDYFEETDYCEKSIQSIKIALQYDFVLDYGLSKALFGDIIKILVESVLRRISEDLTFLIKYVDKWHQQILENSEKSMNINQIYEQVIYISKKINKFESLNRELKGNIVFPRYKIDKGLNQSIEKIMVDKQADRIIFLSEKRLKTQQNQQIVMNEGSQQITQSEMLFNSNI